MMKREAVAGEGKANIMKNIVATKAADTTDRESFPGTGPIVSTEQTIAYRSRRGETFVWAIYYPHEGLKYLKRV